MLTGGITGRPCNLPSFKDTSTSPDCLLTRGAKIEYVDSNGYSVLSYLWIFDKSLEISMGFMRLLSCKRVR